MRRSWPIVGVALSLVLAPVSLPAQATALRIDAGGRSTVIEPAAVPGGIGYGAAALEAMGARVMALDGSVRAILLDDTISFWIGSPFFLARGAVQPLVSPVTAAGGVALIPRQFFTE